MMFERLHNLRKEYFYESRGKKPSCVILSELNYERLKLEARTEYKIIGDDVKAAEIMGMKIMVIDNSVDQDIIMFGKMI